jgi:hypothetical protein
LSETKWGEEKLSKTEAQNETIEEELEPIEISIELPLKVINFLHDLAKFAGTDIEGLLKAELTQVIKDFYNGGFLDSWIKKAFKDRGVSDYFEIPA